MKTRVTDECIGDGICADICPEVFEMQDDGLAHVKVETVPPELEDKCRECEDACPAVAIIVED